MVKKLCVIFSACVFLFCLTARYSAPLFYQQGKKLQVYLGSASSLATIKKVELSEFFLLKQIKGESAEYDLNDFCLDAFMKKFNAKIVFTERVEEGESFYAYSPKIRYKKVIDGKLVNLHVFVCKSNVKVGSPIIFGSF